MKKIIDATCGSRSMWFDKQNKDTVFCDIRRGEYEKDFGKGHGGVKHLIIDPDIVCDFTDLPFDDNTFYLAVFDPPHYQNLSEKAWLRASYGSLDENWKKVIHDGFWECMRVLKPNGVLIFKWAEVKFTVSQLIEAIECKPLFGHRSGKKAQTHWLCFMKGTDA